MWGGGQFRSLAPEAARTVTVVLRGTQSAFSEKRVTGKYCGEGGGACDRRRNSPSTCLSWRPCGAYSGPQVWGSWARAPIPVREREVIGACFIRFLKQIVLERILLPHGEPRSVGVCSKRIADALRTTRVGAKQLVLPALRGPWQRRLEAVEA